MTVSSAKLSAPAGWFARRLDRLSDTRFAIVAFMPGSILVAVFLGIPIAAAVAMSFFRIEPIRTPLEPFVGLKNYNFLTQDSELLASVPLTVGFSMLTTVVVVPLSLAAALILNRRFRGVTALGVAMLLPWAVAPIATGLYWQFMFQAQFGVMTAIMNSLGLTHGAVQWLENSTGAVLIAGLATAWRSAPLYTVLLLAALKSIPGSLYSAAKVDGATDSQAFRWITLPALRNTLLIVVILQLIASLQVFDLLYTLTQGGPGTSTTVVIYYIFQTAFEQLNFGYSAAMAIFLTVIIAVCTALLVLARVRGARPPAEESDADLAASQAGAMHLDRLRALGGMRDAPRRRSIRVPGWIGRIAMAVAGILLLAWSLGPIAWMLIASLQTEGGITSIPLQLSTNLQWSNYTNLVFNSGQYATLPWISSFWVSIQVSVLATFFTIVIAALIAYPLTRLQVPNKGLFMGVLIATQMVPAIVLAIPVLIIFQHLGMVDSVPGLVIVNVAFSIPVVVWLLRNVFEEVPASIESAARIDGCSRLGTLFRVTVPAARPGIAAAAILMLIGTWNEFLFAVVLGNHDAVTVTRLIGLVNTTTGPMGRPPYTLVAAAGILSIVPCIVLVAAFHRRIVQGLSQGYVKG